MKKILKLGVLISGSGSNLQSIIDHIQNGSLRAEIKIVVSNNPQAYGLTRAQNAGIPCKVLNHLSYDSRDDFDAQLIRILNEADVDLIVLAGFMRILTKKFLSAFVDKVINIHPALLPSFPGTHVQQKAIDYGVRFSGCTVHFVEEGVDTGPIIIQAVVPVCTNDNAEALAARILKAEHKIYPQAIRYFAENRILKNGRNVVISDVEDEQDRVLYNPPLDQRQAS